MGSRVGNVTSLLYLTYYFLYGFCGWLISFWLALLLSRESFSYPKAMKTPEWYIPVSLLLHVFCLNPQSARPSFPPLPPFFPTSSFSLFFFHLFFLLITEIEPKDFVTAKMFHTTQLNSWPMTPVKLTAVISYQYLSKGRPFPRALCWPLYPKGNPPLVHGDVPFSLPPNSVTKYSVGFPS